MMLDVGTGYLPDFIRNDVLAHLPTRSGEGIHRALYDLARCWRRTARSRNARLSFEAMRRSVIGMFRKPRLRMHFDAERARRGNRTVIRGE